ncbi:hypothetical protein PPL_05287 [Heterostelium album PN500]|uniref:Ankyrin repeat-containing protein n=1 Tax=Heterostelium pallidum (strain ATCC 26659 / Pp 5 / PN500) TaxID=670386 RepID=D3BBA0_HETP5|nr:hypothetical protein PPL_05287 [Heterostelium album PN500]EFA81307.1 hypothetical protein PPL_05287 [Heterostelium album PN500]|eukprot:XP_020433425.1 hypothetical protein PPL_05287 [Heterostelium album PN500]
MERTLNEKSPPNLVFLLIKKTIKMEKDVKLQVLRQRHLFKKILSFISQNSRSYLINLNHISRIHQNVTRFPVFRFHCHYNDIISVEWIIRNKYYTLFFEKIKRNEYLYLNRGTLITILQDTYLTGSLAIFNVIFQRFHYWFKEDRSGLLDVLLTSGSIEVIQMMIVDQGIQPSANSILFLLQRANTDVLKAVIKCHKLEFWKSILSTRVDHTHILQVIYTKAANNLELIRFFFAHLWPLFLINKKESEVSAIYTKMFSDIIELKDPVLLKVMSEEFKVPFSSSIYRSYYFNQLFLCQFDSNFYEMTIYLFKSNLNEYEYNRLNIDNQNQQQQHSKHEIYEKLVKIANIVYPDAIIPATYNDTRVNTFSESKATTATTNQYNSYVHYNSKIEYGNFWTVDEYSLDMNDNQLDQFISKYYDVPLKVFYPEDDIQLPIIKTMKKVDLVGNSSIFICACANGLINIVKYMMECQILERGDLGDGMAIAFYFKRYNILSYLLYQHKVNCDVKILEAIGIAGDIDGFNCFFNNEQHQNQTETNKEDIVSNKISLSGYEMAKMIMKAAIYGRSQFLEHVFKCRLVDRHQFAMILEAASNHQKWNVFSKCIDILAEQFDDRDGNTIRDRLESAARICLEQGNIEMFHKLREKYNYVPIIDSQTLTMLLTKCSIPILYYLYDTVPGFRLNKKLLKDCFKKTVDFAKNQDITDYYNHVMNDSNNNNI